MAPGCASNRDDDTTVMGYSPLVPNSRRCAVLGPTGLGKIRSKLKMTVDELDEHQLKSRYQIGTAELVEPGLHPLLAHQDGADVVLALVADEHEDLITAVEHGVPAGNNHPVLPKDGHHCRVAGKAKFLDLLAACR